MSAVLTCFEIAARHRLHRSQRGWRGDCPACGYAGSFSMAEGRNGTPLTFCASCRDRDGLAAAIGMPPRKLDPADEAHAEATRSGRREAALRLWEATAPLAGTLAATYLAARHIPHLAACPDLRFRDDCGHPDGGKLPAMVGLVRDAGGEPVAVHRTFLRRDGSGKAKVIPAKASLGPVWGGAIRLAPLAVELVICEGVESSAAAGLLTGLPAWAAISAGNLANGLTLPVDVRSVVIGVDRDGPGERAAACAAQRWRTGGRVIRFLVPDHPGQDAADVLARRGGDHA